MKFYCVHCGKNFEMNWFKWLFTTPFHMFGKRKTKCPVCGKKSWTKPTK